MFWSHFFFRLKHFLIKRTIGYKPQGLYKISPLRTYVRASRHISKTAPRIFPKFGIKLGLNRASNVTRPLFWILASFYRKSLSFGEIYQNWRHFGVFETLRKNSSDNFFLILPKCAKKMYLLHKTIFSPVKHQF